MANLASMLRQGPRQLPQEMPSSKPSEHGPMIEFEKHQGLTTFVHVRSQGKVHTLRMVRDEDGNLLHALVLKD